MLIKLFIKKYIIVDLHFEIVRPSAVGSDSTSIPVKRIVSYGPAMDWEKGGNNEGEGKEYDPSQDFSEAFSSSGETPGLMCRS